MLIPSITVNEVRARAKLIKKGDVYKRQALFRTVTMFKTMMCIVATVKGVLCGGSVTG